MAHHWYGKFLALMKRFEEAIAEKKRAQEMDPLSPVIRASYAYPFLLSRRFDEAIEMLRKAIDLEPNFWLTHYWLGHAYMGKRMYEEAVREFQKANNLSGQSPSCFGCLSAAYSLANRKTEALRALQQLNELKKKGYVSSFEYVFVYIGLGDNDRALEYLQESYRTHDHFMPYIATLPILDSLRSDPRFQEIERKMCIWHMGCAYGVGPAEN